MLDRDHRGWAHPRRRGDGSLAELPGTCHGLTPAGAGTARHRHDLHARQGLTPAGAGTANPDRDWWPSPARAHPRRRGDGSDILRSPGRIAAGSPPQARGRRCWRTGVGRLPGAHPRRRGDGRLPVRSIRLASHQGLTPAGAGTATNPTRTAKGLTPAGAGTAWRTGPVALPHRAHPRRRGDGRCRLDLVGGGLTPAGAGTADGRPMGLSR